MQIAISNKLYSLWHYL